MRTPKTLLTYSILPALFVVNVWLINQGSGFTIPRELLFRTHSQVWKPILFFIIVSPLSLLLVNILKNKATSQSVKFLHVFIICTVYCFSLFLTVQTNPDWGRYHAEAKYLLENGAISFWKNWGKFQTNFDMPLVPFFYGLSYLLFGEGQLAVLAINFLILGFSLMLVYSLTKKIFGKKTGLLSVFLFALNPYLPTQITLMLVDLGETLFTLLAFYLIYGAIKEKKDYFVPLAGFVIFLTALSKILSPIYLAPLLIVSVYWGKKEKRGLKNLFIWLIAFFLGLLYFLWKKDLLKEIFLETYFFPALAGIRKTFFILIFGSTLAFVFSKKDKRLKKLTEKVPLWLLVYVLLGVLFFLPTKARFYLRTPFVALGIPTTFLFYSSIYYSLRSKQATEKALPLILWAFIPLALPNTMFKYQLPAYPAMAILSAFSLMSLARDIKRWSPKIQVKNFQLNYLVIISTFSISILYFFFLPMIKQHTKNNIREAARFINSQKPQKVIVLFHPVGDLGQKWLTYIDETATKPTPSLIHLLDFYSKGDFEYQDKEEFIECSRLGKLPKVLVLTTHFYHEFEMSSELEEVIQKNYTKKAVFNRYRTGAGIWRVKLEVYVKN